MGDHQSFVSQLRWIQCIFLLTLTLGLGGLNSRPAWAELDSMEWAPEIGISFPQPLQIGASVTCSGNSFFCHSDWKYYLNSGFFWLPLNSGSRNLNEFSIETGVRTTPFSIPLILGLGLGFRSIGFSTSDIGAFTIEGSGVASQVSLTFSTLYLCPNVGWQFALSDNLDFGIQAGVQLAVAGYGSLFLSNPSTGENSDNSNLLSTGSGLPLGRVASLALPTLTLLRLSWRLD